MIGFQGLSPYYFEIDAALFIGESGQSAFRFEAEYEQMITQRWVLIPEIELNFFGQTDLDTETGGRSFSLRNWLTFSLRNSP